MVKEVTTTILQKQKQSSRAGSEEIYSKCTLARIYPIFRYRINIRNVVCSMILFISRALFLMCYSDISDCEAKAGADQSSRPVLRRHQEDRLYQPDRANYILWCPGHWAEEEPGSSQQGAGWVLLKFQNISYFITYSPVMFWLVWSLPSSVCRNWHFWSSPDYIVGKWPKEISWL